MPPLTILVAVVVLAACGAPIQTTAEPITPVTSSVVPSPPPDVRFMQSMIAHHAQALTMTRLVPGRSSRNVIDLLAQRIERSQSDEIAAIRRWLLRHGHAIPDSGAHAGHHGGHQAPGMLTPQELANLAAASGAAFDRLFLEYMIRHHEGALAMVKDLFATPGAAQDSELFRFASDVDADQRAEIARMQTLLRTVP
jgi:uncharacterized protein (DUF305 family)